MCLDNLITFWILYEDFILNILITELILKYAPRRYNYEKSETSTVLQFRDNEYYKKQFINFHLFQLYPFFAYHCNYIFYASFIAIGSLLHNYLWLLCANCFKKISLDSKTRSNMSTLWEIEHYILHVSESAVCQNHLKSSSGSFCSSKRHTAFSCLRLWLLLFSESLPM